MCQHPWLRRRVPTSGCWLFLCVYAVTCLEHKRRYQCDLAGIYRSVVAMRIASALLLFAVHFSSKTNRIMSGCMAAAAGLGHAVNWGQKLHTRDARIIAQVFTIRHIHTNIVSHSTMTIQTGCTTGCSNNFSKSRVNVLNALNSQCSPARMPGMMACVRISFDTPLQLSGSLGSVVRRTGGGCVDNRVEQVWF